MKAWAAAALLALTGCAGMFPERKAEFLGDPTLTGIDILREERFLRLQGKRVGLITSAAAVARDGVPTAELLATAPGVRLVALFRPPPADLRLDDEILLPTPPPRRFGEGRNIIVPEYSLQRGIRPEDRKPAPGRLVNLDVLIFDLPPLGLRFDNGIAVLALAIDAVKEERARRAAELGLDPQPRDAAGAPMPVRLPPENDLRLMVLDRPNPLNGELIEGPILDDAAAMRKQNTVAFMTLPVRHGLTFGELAAFYNLGEEVLSAVEVVAMRFWERDMYFEETRLPWREPTTNIPDVDTLLLYAATGMLEYTNISIGRGTDKTFRWIGAPWLRVPELLRALNKAKHQGLAYEPLSLTPTSGIYGGEAEGQDPARCSGILFRVTDRKAFRPIELFLTLATVLRDQYPKFKVDGREELKKVTLAESGDETLKRFYPPDQWDMPYLDALERTVPWFHLNWAQSYPQIGAERFKVDFDGKAYPREFIKQFDKQAREFDALRWPFLLY